MMTTWIGRLVVSVLLPGMMVMGTVQAASVNSGKSAAKQQKQQKIAKKKITHPCARKSAAQLNRRARPYLKSINTHAKKYGVDSDLVKSVITIESCYRKKALSPKGAQGLMQLIPATAERFGIKNPYDSHQNILGGSRYLSWLLKRFDGDLSKVLAAYNAGEGRVERYNGIPPFRETRNYVHDVLAVYKKFKQQGSPQLVGAEVKKPGVVVKPVAARTPQQLRQINQRKQQLLRQAQQRKRQQQQRLAELKKQRTKRSGPAVVKRKPVKSTRPVKPVRKKVVMTSQIVIGKPPLSAAAQQRLAQQAARKEAAKKRARHLALRKAQATKRQPPLRKARAAKPRPQPGNFVRQQVEKAPGGRVRSVFNTATKPGRGGWLANKALAPHLFKQ